MELSIRVGQVGVQNQIGRGFRIRVCGLKHDMKTSAPLRNFAVAVLILVGAGEARAASSDIPQPVTSHPRLWITTNDLPRLRAWAMPTNPVYQALLPVLAGTMNNYDTK